MTLLTAPLAIDIFCLYIDNLRSHVLDYIIFFWMQFLNRCFHLVYFIYSVSIWFLENYWVICIPRFSRSPERNHVCLLGENWCGKISWAAPNKRCFWDIRFVKFRETNSQYTNTLKKFRSVQKKGRIARSTPAKCIDRCTDYQRWLEGYYCLLYHLIKRKSESYRFA